MPKADLSSEISVSPPVAARDHDPASEPVAKAVALCRSSYELLSELRGQMNTLRAQHARFSALIAPAGPFAPEHAADRTWPQYGFTGREAEVARLLAQGRRNSAIAAELGISAHTARHHTQRVLAKLGVHSRAEAGAKLRG